MKSGLNHARLATFLPLPLAAVDAEEDPEPEAEDDDPFPEVGEGERSKNAINSSSADLAEGSRVVALPLPLANAADFTGSTAEAPT